MYPNRPKNRKRARKRLRQRKAKANNLDTLRDQEHQLNAQIGELEEVLASHDRQESRRRDHVMPPEYRSKPKSTHVSYSERRRRRKKAGASSLYFFILLAIASALAFWLFYTGG